MTTKTKRPALRPADLVTLASHVRHFPTSRCPIDGHERPPILADTVLRVSSVSGKGTKTWPWVVSVTDGHRFLHLDADEVVKVEVAS
jgi:hypothetical protein